MKPFVYLKQAEKPSFFPRIREEQYGDCCVLTLSKTGHFYDKWLEKRMKKRGLPVFSEIPLGKIPVYQPHKKLFYEQLEVVLKKAGRRLKTDFFGQDIGIVCDTFHQAEWLIPRLTAPPVIWVFCSDEEPAWENEETSPVFFSREEENLRRLPVVIALTEHSALSYLSPKAVLFNLTTVDRVREYTVNDAFARIPPELKGSGIPKKILNSILFDLHETEKISSLQWG